MSRRSIRKNRFIPLTLYIAVLVIFFAATLGAGAATTWKGPANPPTDVTNLDSPIDFSDLVSMSILQKQTLQGPLYVANSDSYAARLGLNATRTFTTYLSATENGENTSITIGLDGLPIISMFHDLNKSLAIVQCINEACTSLSALRDYDVDADDAGRYTDIAIGSDGYPVISYSKTNGTVGQVKFLRCTKFDCSSAEPPVILDQSNTHYTFGRYTSIAIASDGNPIVSYWAGSSLEDLKVIHCKNPSCLGVLPTDPVTIDNVHTVNGHTSIAVVGTRPAISYTSSSKVYYAYCNDNVCSSATIKEIGAADNRTQLVFDKDGLPVIVYNNGDRPYIAHCTTVNCQGVGVITTQKISDDLMKVITVTLLGDGNPFIVYNKDTSPPEATGVGALTVVRCLDITCSTHDASSPLVLDNASSDSLDMSVTIASDGMPIISYQDQVANVLKVMHCANWACNWAGSRKVGALGIGKSSSYRGFLPEFAEGNYGVMGYAAGGGGNYGIYAYSAGGVGIGAKVNSGANNFAGYFYGPVKVEDVAGGPAGNVNAQSVASKAGAMAKKPSAPAVDLEALTTHVAGAYALKGNVADSINPLVLTDTSVLGQSISDYGIKVTSQSQLITSYGSSQSYYGVYGYSTAGTGVIGEADTARTNGWGVYGESVDYGIYGKGVFGASSEAGAGVFACGTQEAGHFVGNVRVLGSLTMGVAADTYGSGSPPISKTVTPQVSLTEAQLIQISAAAVAASYTGAALISLP